jgi:hypothetical protein
MALEKHQYMNLFIKKNNKHEKRINTDEMVEFDFLIRLA